MRFMVMMIPGVYSKPTDPNFTPPADAIEKMMKYNEALAKAGVLVALDGLTPPEKAARVSFKGGKAVVRDGPFAEAKEVVGGYWILQVKSRDEAIEWARRIPAEADDIVEIRQIFEITDFPPEAQASAEVDVVQAALRR